MLKVIKLKLKELLKNDDKWKGKPLRKIAEGLKIDHVSLWKMLNGKPYNPSLEMLDKLCKELKCESLTDLVEFKKSR